MEAFYKNINALEKQTEVLIQKWANTRKENQHLIERNKQLEEELQAKNSVKTPVIDTGIEPLKTKTTDNLSQIKESLDNYIKQIDDCLSLINNELDGE